MGGYFVFASVGFSVGSTSSATDAFDSKGGGIVDVFSCKKGMLQ